MANWVRDVMSVGLRVIPAVIGGVVGGFSGATSGYSIGQTIDTSIGGQGEDYNSTQVTLGELDPNAGKMKNPSSIATPYRVSGTEYSSDFDKWGLAQDKVNSVASLAGSAGLFSGSTTAATAAPTVATGLSDITNKTNAINNANLAANTVNTANTLNTTIGATSKALNTYNTINTIKNANNWKTKSGLQVNNINNVNRMLGDVGNMVGTGDQQMIINNLKSQINQGVQGQTTPDTFQLQNANTGQISDSEFPFIGQPTGAKTLNPY